MELRIVDKDTRDLLEDDQVGVWLEYEDGGIVLRAGTFNGYAPSIVLLGEDGLLYRVSYVDPDLGFKLDEGLRIKVYTPEDSIYDKEDL